MHIVRKPGVFDPHESARADSLVGVPLASFGRRLSAYAIDMILVFGTYGPAMASLRNFSLMFSACARSFTNRRMCRCDSNFTS